MQCIDLLAFPSILTGRGSKEAHASRREVPEGHHWCLSCWHHGQEEPEARGSQGPAGAGHQVRNIPPWHEKRAHLTSAAPARTVEMWPRDVQSAFKLMLMLASQLAIAFFSYFAWVHITSCQSVNTCYQSICEKLIALKMRQIPFLLSVGRVRVLELSKPWRLLEQKFSSGFSLPIDWRELFSLCIA